MALIHRRAPPVPTSGNGVTFAVPARQRVCWLMTQCSPGPRPVVATQHPLSAAISRAIGSAVLLPVSSSCGGGDRMKRRDVLCGLLVTTLIPSARAQQSSPMRRIAVVHPSLPITALSASGNNQYWRAFFAELRQLGFSEGTNLVVERYS